MGGVVVFNYTDWIAQYPEFTTTVPSSGVGQRFFNRAAMLLNNTAASPVCDATQPGGQRETLLYILTAHCAFIGVGDNTNKVSPLVGRVNDATQGSVNVKAEMPGVTANSAYYMQTKYGAEFWAMTASYRTARGIRGPGQRPAPAPAPNNSGFWNGVPGPGWN